MRWPFTKREPERRQSVPFTDAVVAALAAEAGGQSVGDPSAIAALEAAVTLYGRAFAAATVTPAGARPLLSPPFLSLLARNLIRRGEDLHQIMFLITTQAKRNLSSRSGIGGVRSAT